MIALMYPKDDYTAEQICTQVGLNMDDVYVVPKRIRNEEVIVKKLEKAEHVILVVFDPWVNLDGLTRRDIRIAMQKGKKITAILKLTKYKKLSRNKWFCSRCLFLS